MKKILFGILCAISLSANVAVSGDDYNIIKTKDIDLIYASEYKLPKDVLEIQEGVIEDYSKSFGYKLDDKLYLGLLSSNNQVANAFSTQIPLNMQIDFGAGALENDYFSSKSWIKTLLYHESAHNFQINPKKNLLSRYAHKIFKNNFYNGSIIPIFPVPNLACSPFMLEGNAVLNESWHDNGGRLYNGSLLAMAITQAKAGYITPSRTYNQHLYFPYSTHNYIIGGFFNLFLAQKYGLDQVNRYFYNFSGQWIPIFTNNVFKESFGIDYEEAIREYSSWLNSKYKDFKPSKGEIVAKSKQMIKLSKTTNKIIFLTSDRKSSPRLMKLSLDGKIVSSKKTTLPWGRVFEIDHKDYTLASASIATDKIKVGLFDEDANILEFSKSKAIQAVIDDKKFIYFDIANSFDQPMAYVDDKFYDKVNSSIYRSNSGSLYYFKQDAKRRTLYKDKKPLYTYQGWYGFVCDVDMDSIYFVANSKYGSTLFRYKDGVVVRVVDGDDVIDAKLLNNQKVLLETITADGVEFKISKLKQIDSAIYETKYFFEDKKSTKKSITSITPTRYKPISNMHYSSLENMANYDENGIDISITANFTDALMQNKFSIFASKFDDDSIAGFGYDNSAYRLNFGFAIYAMLDHDSNVSSREYGLNTYIRYPIFETKYTALDSSLTYSVGDERDDKEPLVFTLSYSDAKHFGDSMYLNYGDFLSASLGYDRDDKSMGLKYFKQREISDELYMSFNLSAATSEVKNEDRKRGIKIESYKNNLSNALNFEMPSLINDIYVKSIIKAGLGVKKVLNYDKYFFSFPISLRREAIYGKYNYYDLTFKDDFTKGYSEFTLGFKADMLYFNSLVLPISIEYIYNDDLTNSSDYRVLFDMIF